MSSVVSGKRRSIQEHQPRVSIDDQIAAIDEMIQNISDSLKGGYSDESSINCVQYAAGYKDSTISLLQSNWNFLRSAARQNRQEEIEEQSKELAERLDSLKKTTCSIQRLVFKYIKKGLAKISDVEITSDAVEKVLLMCQDLSLTYVELIDKYVQSAEKIKLKSFVSELKNAKFNYAIELNSATIKVLRDIHGFCIDLYNQKLDQQELQTVSEIFERFAEYFFTQTSHFHRSYELAVSYYPLQHIFTGESTDNEQLIEKYHNRRNDVFETVMDIIRSQIELINQIIDRASKPQEEEQGEEEDAYNASALIFEYQIKTIDSFFNIIYEELIQLMKLTFRAAETEHISNASQNLLDLFANLRGMNISEIPSYQQYVNFYTTALKINDQETAIQLQQDLLESLDATFEDLVNKLQQERSIRPLISEDDIEPISADAAELRKFISDKIRELLPVLSTASKDFFTQYHPNASNEEEEEEEEKFAEEEDDHPNHFSDFIDYLNELLHKHLKELKLAKCNNDEERESVRKSPKSSRSEIDGKTDEGLSRRSRLTQRQAEQGRKSLEDCYKNILDEAIVGTTADLIEILRIKIIETVRVDLKEAIEISKELPSLVAQNGKILSEMRKKAALEVNIERVKEIDQMIVQNDVDQRAEILKCFDQAFRDVIENILTNFMHKHCEFVDEHNRENIAQENAIEEKFQLKEKNLHIPEMTNLYKKYYIEKEMVKRKQFPEVEHIRQQAARLTQQKDYDQAQIKVNEMEKLRQKLMNEALFEIDRKHKERLQKLEEKQQKELKQLENEGNREKAWLDNQFEENIRRLKLTFKSSINFSVSEYASAALKLMATNNTKDVQPGKGPTKDGQSRKQMTKRLEAIAREVIKEQQQDTSIDLSF